MAERWDPDSGAKKEIGDLIPIYTSMGNTIYCEVLDVWTYFKNDVKQDLGYLLEEKALLYMVDELEFRYNHDLKSHILGTGDLGSGKSTLSLVLYKLFKSPLFNDKDRYHDLLKTDNWTIQNFLRDSKMDINDCCFKLEELRARCKRNTFHLDPTDPKGRRKIYDRNFYIMDESGKELSSHRWQDRYVEDMKQQLDISRVKREIIHMNLPHLKGIIKGIRDTNADFLSYCLASAKGQDYERGVVEFREAEKNRWVQDIFWEGLLCCRFPKLEDDDYYTYVDKKLDYVEAASDETKVVDNSIEDRRIIGERLMNKEFMNKLKLEPISQTKTAKILEVHRRTVYRDQLALSEKKEECPETS